MTMKLGELGGNVENWGLYVAPAQPKPYAHFHRHRLPSHFSVGKLLSWHKFHIGLATL